MESLSLYLAEFQQLMRKPQLFAMQLLSVLMIISTALMLWRGLMAMAGSESPMVVVLSGSMEPGMYRGDILLLSKFRGAPLAAGDVVVFEVADRGIPIVHRILNTHLQDNGSELTILTKGDNNSVDDRGLYAPRQKFITSKNVLGRAYAFLPYMGMITILLNDYPWLKYLMIGSMAFFVMIGRDQNA